MIRKRDGAASVLTERPTPVLPFFVTAKQSCVRAGRQAPSKCQVCVTHKHCAVQSSTVQMNIHFFLFPPPCSAVLKSDFPTIWCRILVLDGPSGCSVNIASAELPRTEITQLHRCHFLRKVTLHHTVGTEGGWQQAEGTQRTCPLKLPALPRAGGLVSEAFIFWNASLPAEVMFTLPCYLCCFSSSHWAHCTQIS